MNPKTKTLIVLFLSFALGCVIGAAVLPGVWRSMTHRSGERSGYREIIHQRLSLDSVQMNQVDSLLDAYGPRFEVHRLAMQQTRDSLRTDLREFLTTDQKVSYQKMVDEMNKRSSRRSSDTLQSK